MAIHFWPFLVGALILIWGIVTLLTALFNIQIPISWWGVAAIVVGMWILARAIRRPGI